MKYNKTERRKRTHQLEIFNPTLSMIDIEIRPKKISKYLNYLTFTHLLLPTTACYILFSNINRMFAKIDHILGHKNFNKFRI